MVFSFISGAKRMKKFSRNYIISTIRHFITSSLHVLKQNPQESLLLFIILGIFLANTLYLSYPDEFVNLLGGKFLLEGKLPYRGFFDNHMPMAWLLSAFFLLFSFNSFVLFRIWWALFMFITLFVLGWYIRKNYKELYAYYVGFFFFYAITTTYFWSHLFVADSIASLFFAIAFWLCLVQTLTKKIDTTLIQLATLCTFCIVFTSLTYIYVAGVLYVWQLYLFSKTIKWTIWKSWLPFLKWVLTPYVVFFLYLLLTGSLRDFYFANITYNTQHYVSIENYEKGQPFNPITFALTLIYNFGYDAYPILTKIKELDLFLPIASAAVIASLSLIIYFFFYDKTIAILLFLLLSFSAPRSSIQKTNEGDYQISLFLTLGITTAWITLYLFRTIPKYITEQVVRDIMRIVHVLLMVFMFFTGLFLIKNVYNKTFQLYTHKMPTVNNIAPTAQFIDQIIHKGEYYWVGPFEPHHVFFVTEGQQPGKYTFIMPQFREDEKLRHEVIQQFEQHPPKMIIYKHDGHIFGTNALEFGKFIFDWMQGKYSKLSHIVGVKIKHGPATFNIKEDVYILNKYDKEILKRLEERGYIEYEYL